MKTTLRTLFLITGLFLAFSAQAQDWQSSYTEAKALSEETGKPLLILFSGSDWCRPCMRLDEMVWKNDAFVPYASENVILYHADFPRRPENKLPEALQAAHNELANTYKVNGFPTVVIVQPDGKVSGKIVGNGGHTDYDSYLKKLNKLVTK